MNRGQTGNAGITGSRQVSIPLARPDISAQERDLVNQVLSSGQLSRGPFLARFEQAAVAALGVEYAVATSSGTAALMLGLRSLGVKPGDEVITVSYTVPATINAIVALGARPVLVDVTPETRGLCPKALQAAISPRTAAVVVVHAFGQAVAWSEIEAVCRSAGIPLLEDACEAFGNRLDGVALGCLGDCGVFGFYPNKQITTGEGGLLVTRYAALARRSRRWLNNGREMDGCWLDQADFGWNFRLDEMSAALGLGQIRRLAEMLAARRQVAHWYDELLAEHLPQWRRPAFGPMEKGNAWFAYVVHAPHDGGDLVQQAEFMQRLAGRLLAKGIQSGRYFAPVHRQPAFVARYGRSHLPVTEALAATGLALPFYNQLTRQQVECVILGLRQTVKDLCE